MQSKLQILIYFFVIFTTGTVLLAENSTEFYNRGVDSFRQGDLNSAEKFFISSVNLNRSYCLAHYGLGRVYLKKTGRISDAISHLKRSTELDTSFSKGFFYLGIAQMLNDKGVEALHSFNEAFRLNPGLIESLYNMGVVYEGLGRQFKAFEQYKKYYDSIEKKGESPF